MCFTVIDDAPIMMGGITKASDVTGGITGASDVMGASQGVYPLPNLHNLQSIT